jgi:spermidine synthase
VRELREAHPGRLGLRAGLPAVGLGFLAAVVQIYLLREFNAQFFGNELTYGVVLAAWLLWGGVGSTAAGRWRSRPAAMSRIYVSLALLVPVALLILRYSRRLLGLLPGEMTGVAAIFVYSLVVCGLTALPLGILFVLNARAAEGDVSRIYFLESAGAAAGGLFVQFVLVSWLPSWPGLSVAMGLTIAVILAVSGSRRDLIAGAAGIVCLALLAGLDGPSQRAVWEPFELARSEDSPHGRLSVIRTAEQITLYANGLTAFSSPDRPAAEEAVHFALLQRPAAQHVLLIGGGAGGAATEVLRYPRARLDYVELDPEIIRLALTFLSPADKAALEDRRTRLILQDGRQYLKKRSVPYDAILLNLPEPSTALLNRFYTRDFFREARGHLTSEGVLSFIVPGAENYLSADRRDFVASLWTTLKDVFPVVAVVPGPTHIFLASGAPLTLDAATLAARHDELGLRTVSLTAVSLAARLSASRRAVLDEALRASPGRLNTDEVPVSYYFDSVLWASQFRGLESRLLRSVGRLGAGWALAFPLAVILAGLAATAALRRRAPDRFLVPLAVTGFTSIVAEVVLLIAYQSDHGLVYGRIALLTAMFMAGLAAGAWLARLPGAGRLLSLKGWQTAVLALLILIRLAAARHPSQAVYFLALAGLGLTGGGVFVSANRRLLAGPKNLGLGYGLDLWGSFLGVLVAAAFLIPLFGTLRLLTCLVILNAGACAYVIYASRGE